MDDFLDLARSYGLNDKQALALFDAAHGVKRRACKNPECNVHFPVSGPNALRIDAKYCSETCRLRDAYLRKTAA